MTFALFYLIGLLVCSGEAVLQVTISLGKVELSVGESKFFTCTVIGEPVSIEWYSPDGQKVISNERVVVQTEGIRSRLTIYNANEEDAGIYQCQVLDVNGKSQEATILVEIYKKLTFHEIKSPQEFREGDDAVVICEVNSSPAPIVTWLHNNRDIITELSDKFTMIDNNSLKIRRISKKNEGIYRCEGRVEARGEIDFRDISVIVNVPPVIHVPKRSVNATADRQESVTLTCTATGSPEPDISWYRDGRLIEDDDKYVSKRSTELTIRNIAQEDTGAYICRATNKAGTVEEQLSVKVFVPPHITLLKNETATENGHVVITCDADGDPTPSISWSRFDNRSSFPDEEKIPNGRIEVRRQKGTSSLHIRNIKPSDSGAYHCEATSPIGQDEKSMHLDIQYAPKFLSTQVTYYSWEGNSVNISCDVTANPQASIHWKKEGVVLSDINKSDVSIYKKGTKILLEITPAVDSDFGSYNCTASNQIGTRSQEFTLVQAAVPSRPYGLRVLAVSQTIARISFTKPDSHGGVPIHHYQVEVNEADSGDWKTVNSNGSQTHVVLTNLKPNSTYHFRVAAVNGKGQGEHSQMEAFQTLPVQEPSPPTVQGHSGNGKNYKLVVTKQDDGGSPILRYVLKYRTKDKEEEWMQQIAQGSKDSIILERLQWDMRYEVKITAVNKLGSSEPTIYEFTMPPKPNTIANTLFRSLGLGAVVGLGVAALLLILVITDVSCFFTKQCGLLMCITTRICGKKNGSSTKTKDAEEGKAAYLKDGSKEPIVEMRTEDEPITNHDGSSANEPNETTPLTEPEKLPLKEGNAKEVLSPENIEEAVPNDVIQPKEDSSKA
ncbi:neural cell adhesion molecule 2-like isoform X1 [Chiloscyllium plagiosum]|uniref:neural cell adhesion molecule 2-like isoform X1 n=1 Tax=Chiloscyllium plagiosum TaxID=36176 RepID=UPI001CB7C684|nr:neural cell adhesion molecule 2-like isoform X1 [Chiloscyllium plagiosum]